MPKGNSDGAGNVSVDMKLEVVIIPVSDVDRAKQFYARPGWRLDADVVSGTSSRLIPFTPPGSGCSIQFGANLFGATVASAAPGSLQGLYLIVSDIEVARDEHLRVSDRLWAIGDTTGIWQLTHVGKYQAEVAASNILGELREANYEAVPRAVYTDPQAAAVGATEAQFSATAALKDVAKTATYTRAYAESNGFLTLLSDGEQLTGAYALGPEAGEWLQQATLAIRARVPLAVPRDTIQPFPTFSEIFAQALHDLHAAVRKPVGEHSTLAKA